MTLKIKLFILWILLISFNSYGQLQVDAGNDTTFCFGSQDTIRIGGNPTAIGGVEPYSYVWTTDNSISVNNLLNDTTIANPKIISYTDNAVTLKLTVFDSVGTEKSDSIIIRSVIIMQTLIYMNFEIEKGDTATLPHNTFVYGIEPYTYFWSPDYNISDTKVSNPKAWPDSSMRYYVYVVDSIGCKSGADFVDVTVNNLLSISSNLFNINESSVVPNPISSNSVLYFDSNTQDKSILKIIDLNGQVLYNNKYLDHSFKIGNLIEKKGIYFYTISNGNKILTRGRFIKN